MAKRKGQSKTDHLFRLEGEGFKIERRFPSDDGSMAVAWATGVLSYDEVDGTGKYAREGTVLAPGDYMLSLVGPLQTEPLYRMRKHEPRAQWLVSWEAA